MSDNERDQPDERKLAEDDGKEDLELKDEDADQVRGGVDDATWVVTGPVRGRR